MATCHLHPDRETLRSCSRCGRPACTACLRDAAVGAHCVACIRADQGPRIVQARRQLRMSTALHGFVTPVLIAMNVIVFVLDAATRASGRSTPAEVARSFEVRFAMYGPLVKHGGEWYRIITSGFLHAGVMHLFFNMMALLNLGRFIERILGRVPFALLYLASLIGGGAGILWLEPQSVAVGASGAVFGLMGFAAVALQQRGRSFQSNPLFTTILLNLFITFAIPGISKGGHVGGFVVGALAGIVYRSRRLAIRGRDTSTLALSFGALTLLAAIACVLGVETRVP